MAQEIWRVEKHPTGTFIVSDESPLIATVHDEWQAQKISAVLEMYAALKSLEEPARRIISESETGGNLFAHKWEHALEQARLVIAAIEKADGNYDH